MDEKTKELVAEILFECLLVAHDGGEYKAAGFMRKRILGFGFEVVFDNGLVSTRRIEEHEKNRR